MATSFPAGHPYLSKGFEPIRFECDYADLVVEGDIPKDLSGCLYRIGPNPQFSPRGQYNPLQGDGMIHAFTISGGRVSYRNRWVQTQQWHKERAAGRSLFGTSGSSGDADPQVAGLQTDGVANTNLIWHGKKLLALEEGHAPIEIDPISLETLGVWNFAGKLPGNMTAHPKIDPNTGEMVFFANFPRRDLSGAIDLYIADHAGNLIREQRIQGPFPALVHDFAITCDFIIFFVCPLTISIERLRNGAPPIAWEADKKTWLGVVPRRAGSTMEVRWLPLPASMVWHAMNAFNDREAIYIDVCQQEAAAFPSAAGIGPASEQLRQFLSRWRVDLPIREGVSIERLSEFVCEYPRIDERRCGLPYQYGYVSCHGGPGTDDLFHRGLGRFDHHGRQMTVYRFAAESAASEPLFVPRTPQSREGEGYILAVVFDELRNASHLVIFDAQHLESGPISRALLDHRVPMGFHGLWRPSTLVEKASQTE